MFEDKINKIKKLSEIDMIYFEIYNCIFSRENKEILNKEIKNFQEKFDLLVQKNNFDFKKIEQDKILILKNYEKVISSFLDVVETLFCNVIEKLLITETNQNIILIKKTTIDDVKMMLSNTCGAEDRENLIKTINSLNMSVNNIDEKIFEYKEKINKYEDIISICQKELQVCYSKRENGLEKLRKLELVYDTNLKSNFFNKREIEEKQLDEFIEQCNKYIENLELNIIAQLNDNIFNYIDNFNLIIQKKQEKIPIGGANTNV